MRRKTQTYIGAYSNQTGGTIITILLLHNSAKILFLFHFRFTEPMCSAVGYLVDENNLEDIMKVILEDVEQ